MAQLNNVYDSNDASNINKESLSEIINSLNPANTPFITMAQKGKADNVLHEWTADEWVDSSTSNAQIEGDSFDADTIAAPDRFTNYTQIFRKVIAVSGSEQATGTVGGQDALAYNIAKYGQLLKNDMEETLSGNQAASAGSSTEGRTARSYEAFVPQANRSEAVTNGAGTTTEAADDGTTGQLRAFTEDDFMTVMQSIFEAGCDPDTLLYHPNKAKIVGGFNGQSTRQVDSADARVFNRVDFYATDFGVVEAHVDRFIRKGASTPGRSVLVYAQEFTEVAYLRDFDIIELAKTHDAERRALIAEATFVARNPNALGVIADLSA